MPKIQEHFPRPGTGRTFHIAVARGGPHGGRGNWWLHGDEMALRMCKDPTLDDIDNHNAVKERIRQGFEFVSDLYEVRDVTVIEIGGLKFVKVLD